MKIQFHCPSVSITTDGKSVFILIDIFVSFLSVISDSFYFIYLFVCLFMAALVLRCCAWAFSSCSEWGLLFIAVHGLLIAVASLVAEHRL